MEILLVVLVEVFSVVLLVVVLVDVFAVVVLVDEEVAAAVVCPIVDVGPGVLVGWGAGPELHPPSPQTGPPGGVYGLLADMSRYWRLIYKRVISL